MQSVVPRDAFALKIQRELCHSKYARQVSGLSRNRPLGIQKKDSNHGMEGNGSGQRPRAGYINKIMHLITKLFGSRKKYNEPSKGGGTKNALHKINPHHYQKAPRSGKWGEEG